MNFVALLTPENKILKATYSKLRSICMKECLKEENIDEFMEFQKDYSYFEPYFDFVMFKLKYILINPIYMQRSALYPIEDGLYSIEVDTLDYEKIKQQAQEMAKSLQTIPFMTMSSDESLRIRRMTKDTIKTCLLDSNNVGLLNKNGGNDGSHGITGNTILNQMLLLSPTINKEYIEFLNNENIIKESTALNYLIRDIGFLIITDKSINPLVIANESAMTESQLKLRDDLEKDGYLYYDIEIPVQSLSNEYKKYISPEKLSIEVEHKKG